MDSSAERRERNSQMMLIFGTQNRNCPFRRGRGPTSSDGHLQQGGVSEVAWMETTCRPWTADPPLCPVQVSAPLEN